MKKIKEFDFSRARRVTPQETEMYRKAIENTLHCLNNDDYKVLVIKSTVPPSTTQEKIKSFIDFYNTRKTECFCTRII